MNDEAARKLAAAIMMQSVSDYREHYRRYVRAGYLGNVNEWRSRAREMKIIEKEWCADWCALLMSAAGIEAQGDTLCRSLKVNALKEERVAIRRAEHCAVPKKKRGMPYGWCWWLTKEQE